MQLDQILYKFKAKILKRSLVLLLTLFLSHLLSPTLQAQQNLTLEVEPGFDSFYKYGFWVPIRVTVSNQGPDLQAIVQVQDASRNNSDINYTYPIDLPSQSRKQIELNVPFRSGGRVTVNILDTAGDVILSQPANLQSLNANLFLVGVIASDPSLLNALAGLEGPQNDRVSVAHLTLNDLPNTPQAWTSLDMLIFNDVDTSRLTTTQRDVLRHWVSLGGHLVIGGGPNAAQTIAGFPDLLPFSTVTAQTLVHPLPSLQAYTQDLLSADRGPYIAAVPPEGRGQVIVREGNWPIVTTYKYGLGQTHYIAFDLGLAPMDTLAGRPRFFPQLIDEFVPDSDQLLERTNTSRMQTSLALIPNQVLPRPGTITLYLLLYILAVGPINYFILGRLKRREWAWFSLPIIILLFCGFGYISGFRLRGGQPFLRQITVLYTHANSTVAEAVSFIGVYSPGRTAYDLKIEQPSLVERLSSSAFDSSITVVSGDATLVKDLQADIGGMPAIVAYSQLSSPNISANLTYDKRNNRLHGTVINNTGQPLAQAYLIFEEKRLDIGSLPPGESQINGLVSQHNSYGNFYDTNSSQEPDEALRLASRDIAMQGLLYIDNYQRTKPALTGLILAGWQDGSPVNIDLVDQRSTGQQETLLLVSLPYTVSP